MRSLKTLLSLVPLLAALPAAAAPTQADYEIRFWETRVDQDSADAISPTRLGGAYLQKARETGDFAYYLRAEKVLKKALERQPDHATALTSLASAYLAQHRFKEALALVQPVVKRSPRDGYAWAVVGDALLETGRVAEAQTAYLKLVELEPGLTSYSRLANLQHVKGNVEGALASLTKAADLGRRRGLPAENVAWCYVQMGEMNFSRGRYSDAERYYLTAVRHLPNGYLPLEHLAELRASQGRRQEAIAIYKKVLALAPKPEFYEALGGVYADLGNRAEAEKLLNKALEGYRRGVEGGNVGYYRQLSQFYTEVRKEPAKGVEWAEKDLQLRQDAHAYDTLAWALYHQGDLPKAAELARKATTLPHREADVLFHAGVIFYKIKDYPAATACLRRSLEANPRSDNAETARKTLRVLAASRPRGGAAWLPSPCNSLRLTATSTTTGSTRTVPRRSNEHARPESPSS